MKLLIVDDSIVIRRRIGRDLLQRFSQLMYAEDGRTAISIALKFKPDVITMDLTMPNLDGVQAIKHILKDKPHTHILVVSALADKQTAIKALSLGANGFLCKPFSEQELNDAISKILSVRLAI